MSTPTVTVRIELTDSTDGCTYSRVYVNTPDFSESVHDMVNLVLPDYYPDFVTARIGDGFASGRLVDSETGDYVGSFTVTDHQITMHAITLVWKTNNHGYPWKAECLCGWESWGYVTRHAAQGMGDDHVAAARIVDATRAL